MILARILGSTELILILGILLPVIAIVDILSSRFEANKKVLLLLIVILLPLFGSILYFFNWRSRKMR